MLAEALAMYEKKNLLKTSRCVVGSWRDSLSEEDQIEFDTALSNNKISSVTLLEIFQSVGAEFGITVFRNHRNRACACQN